MNYYNYFSEIEETFNRRRGKFVFLSPLDWALMEDWETRGVPLHVVLRGIEKVFDGSDKKPSARKRSVKSLMYCREEIEAQFEEWNERQVGKNEDEAANESTDFAEESFADKLAEIAAQISAATNRHDGELKESLMRVKTRLKEMTNDAGDAETLEKSLEDLEKILDEALLNGANADAARKEVEAQTAAYRGKMDKEAYERTFNLMLLKKLRDAADIPRLSLFHL